MDMGWVASALEAIYLARNKGLQSTGPPRIRFCGRIVGDSARGEELFRQYQVNPGFVSPHTQHPELEF